MFQAWKLEQEQLKKKREEEEEEKTKKTKNEPKGKQEAKPAGAKKGSSSSAAQKKGAANVEKVPEPPVEDSKEPHPGELTFSLTPTPPSRSGIAAPPPDVRPCVQAFIGLSTGGMLIRLSGRVQHLRPSDGGVVTVEDIRYAEGIKLGQRFGVFAEVVSKSCSSSAGFQLLKVVVEKDGHRFCTHVHHSAAKQVKPESPEQPSHGRTQVSVPVEDVTVSSLSFFLLLRVSAEKRGEAGLLHSAAAQRSPDVLQLLRANRRSSRSPARSRSLAHEWTNVSEIGRLSISAAFMVETVFQVMFWEPRTTFPAGRLRLHLPRRPPDLQNPRFVVATPTGKGRNVAFLL